MQTPMKNYCEEVVYHGFQTIAVISAANASPYSKDETELCCSELV